MTPLGAVLAIAALFLVGVAYIALSEGLTFLAPKTTMGLNASAMHFCKNGCRTRDGFCPLTESGVEGAHCPLWKFINADVPTVRYGSPFAVTSS